MFSNSWQIVGVKRCQVLKSFDRSSYRAGVHSKTSSMDQWGIKELSRRHEHSRLIHLAIRRSQDCNKKQLKSSIDKLGVEEVSRLLKNSFSRREKRIYECIQACNSTNDPNSILTTQNHLSTKKTLAHRSQKYTHALNKFNQFYISKTSQDSLMSIH